MKIITGALIGALFGFCGWASANGPAWVAELSAIDPPHSDALRVVVPAGSHCAIGVYNTDAVAVEDVAGIETTVRVVWFEHRTVFAGMDGQRQAAIPYYLPMLKDCAPTGAWCVEIKPEAVGEYTVPIQCNANTVTVTVHCIDLPASGIGYGFYTDYARFPDPERGPDYYRDMAAHGMNTLTPYARELPAAFGIDNSDLGALLAWHIDTAIEQGLCDTRFPLVCLSCGPEHIVGARQLAKHDWPELISYNLDEPGEAASATVAQYADNAHAAGLRSGTAIAARYALQIGEPLDVWILHMDGMSPEIVRETRARGKARWLYNCALRGSNAALHRYWTGVYTWAIAPEVCLTWTYTHDPDSRIRPDGTWDLRRVYDTATCDAHGDPIPTVALEGMRDGITDSRILQALEAADTPEGNEYLADLRARVEWSFWPGGRDREASSYVWDIPDLAEPPIDPVAMRAEAMRLLGEAGALTKK